MSITPGMTDDEVREFVYAYEQLPWGTKKTWLAEQEVSRHRFGRWRSAVFDGDLARGLIPRDSRLMTSASSRRRTAKNHDATAAEHEQLLARIEELEAVNDALGKAIGLLHQLNEQEPAAAPKNTQATSIPSSLPRTNSFGISIT